MNENSQKSGRFCRECGKYKFFQLFCLRCFKRTNSDIHIFLSDTIIVRDSLRLRKHKVGIKKFIVETISGWFPSLNLKLPDGVNKSRTIDRENNEYYEIVKEYKTGEVIHECRESLDQHKKFNKLIK
jgi:hypothetical protein